MLGFLDWSRRDPSDRPGVTLRSAPEERTASYPSLRAALPRLVLLPGMAVVLAAAVMTAADGGRSPEVLFVAGLPLVVLLALLLVLRSPRGGGRSKLVFAGLGLYALFCAWNYASIWWAEVPGLAWQGANRALLYGVVMALVGLRRWSRRAAEVQLGAVVVAAAGLGIGLIVLGALRADPPMFIDGRLSEPTGYANATAGFWAIAFWPAVCLATRRRWSWRLRGCALAAACLFLELALLTQSRGALIALALSAILVLALTSDRLATLLAVAAVAALSLVGVDPFDIIPGTGPNWEDVRVGWGGDRLGIALSCLAAFALGAAGALAFRRRAPAERRRGVASLAMRYAIATIAVVSLAGAVLALGSSRPWLEERWQDFRGSGYSRVEAGRTRLDGSLGSNRYDFYRVAWRQFRAHPAGGIGADNFSAPYLLERRSSEAPRHPHSLAFRLLAQLGVIGTALFVAFLGLMLAAVRRTLASASSRAVPVAALGGFTVWLVQGMGDWLWEFAGLGALALGLLVLAARIEPDGSHGPPRRGVGEALPGSRAAARGAVVVALAAMAAASLALPGAAASLTRASVERQDAGRALARLDLAARLDPLSAEPLLVKGVLARRLGRRAVAEEALSGALEREPSAWVANAELGLLEAASGAAAAGEREFARAGRLNPREPFLGELREQANRGDRIDADHAELRLSQGFSRADASLVAHALSGRGAAGADDSSPPGAPKLTASSGDGTVRLRWSPDRSREVLFYDVFRNGEWIAYLEPPATAYLDKGLTGGATYNYELRAYDRAHNAAASRIRVAPNP